MTTKASGPVPASVDVSTQPLSEIARHLVYPTGIVDSVWYDLDDRFQEWAIEFDRWQDDAGSLLLGLRDDGKFAATVGGATLSIPRQVAKTFLVGRTVFALSTCYEESTWLWTAHRIRTATQTFQKLAAFAQRKAVKRYLLPDRSDGIRTANGEQEIRFRNGSRLLFGAREQGFGRGFDEVDGEVFDEAQILTERALDDMVPATNQSRNPHGALLIFMGTPPTRDRPQDVEKGEAFTGRRRKALKGKPADQVKLERGDSLFIEFSADPDVGKPGGPSLDDEAQIRKANPSYPHRTPPESIARMRENLVSDDAWRREALGVWDDETDAGSVVDMAKWGGVCLDPLSKIKGRPRFVLDVPPSRAWATIAVAGERADGIPHVEVTSRKGVIDHRAGVEWVVPRAVKLNKRQSGFALTIVSGSSAESLIPALTEAGVPIEFVKSADLPAACGLFFDLIESGGLRHVGQESLTDALKAARKNVEDGEGAWRWGRKKSSADISPLYAATVALWAVTTIRVAEPSALYL